MTTTPNNKSHNGNGKGSADAFPISAGKAEIPHARVLEVVDDDTNRINNDNNTSSLENTNDKNDDVTSNNVNKCDDSSIDFDGCVEVIRYNKKKNGESSNSKDNDSSEEHIVAFKINLFKCMKPIMKWIKEYHVMKILKDWYNEVDWKQIRCEVKDGLNKVDWKQVRSEVKDGLKQVDWDEVKNDIKESMDDVDWDEVKRDLKEAVHDIKSESKSVRTDLKEAVCEVKDAWKEIETDVKKEIDLIDWKGLHKEVQDSLKGVDWKAVHEDLKEVGDIVQGKNDHVNWKTIQKTIVDCCPDDIKDEIAETAQTIDWKKVQEHAKGICPKEIDCDEVIQSVQDALDQTKQKGGEIEKDYIFLDHDLV